MVDQPAEQNLSNQTDGISLISAMVRLGVISQFDDPATAAPHGSGQGVGASSRKHRVDDRPTAPKNMVMLGTGRPGPP
jgi:hypothetical protein